MSKNEIRSWIAEANAETSDDYNDDEPSSVPSLTARSPEDLAADWSIFLTLARNGLLTSSTRERVEFLRDKLLAVATRGELDLPQCLDIFLLLTLTYPRFVDAPSRDAVLDVLEALAKRDESISRTRPSPHNTIPGLVERLTRWLFNEASRLSSLTARNSSASANRFVLLLWSCRLYTTCLDEPPSESTTPSMFTTTPAWINLVISMAFLLDSVLDPHTKQVMRQSAFVNSRRALRTRPSTLPVLANTLLNYAKTASAPTAIAPLLGTFIDVSIRLKPESLRKRGLQYVQELKVPILNYYTSHIFMSRVVVPGQASTAFQDFIQIFVTESDLTDTLLPAVEKATLRSPEIALPLATDLLASYGYTLSPALFQKVLGLTQTNAKSSSPAVRLASINLFKTIVRPRSLSTINPGTPSSTSISVSTDLHLLAANELLSLPKAGKTASVDHRATLYAMLVWLPTSDAVSLNFVSTLPILLSKETNEAAMGSLKNALAAHLGLVLRSESGLEVPKDVTALIAREITGTKVPLRRAFIEAIGDSLWIDTPAWAWSDATMKFASAVLPALETNLKGSVSSPLNAASGPLEGYVTVATILQVASPIPSAKTNVYQILALGGAKPSFLVWDKVYGKLANSNDEAWLLRALQCTFLYAQDDMKKSETLRFQFGNAFLHMAISAQPSTRRTALVALKLLTARAPNLTSLILREAIQVYLSRPMSATPALNTTDESALPPVSANERLPGVILALANFAEETQVELKEDILTEMLVLSHHSDIAKSSRQLWIETLQVAHVDPRKLVVRKSDDIMKHILKSWLSPTFISAAKAAATTVSFVAPDVLVPQIVDQIKMDIDISKWVGITQTDIGIWQAVEGTLFVDVLAAKKAPVADTKGKNRDIEKWEAETRKSIAAKKKTTAPPTLSKQDQALINAQLRTESETRQHVQGVVLEIKRGLGLIHSLVASKVDAFQQHIWALSDLLLKGIMKRGSALIGAAALEAYLDLSASCSERLGVIRTSIGLATLRASEIPSIPEEYLAEPLEDLVIRILYRLRFLAEQSPFDAATFAYTSPLLTRILELGGAGAPQEESALEQITLTLEVIQFHADEFAHTAFPRLEILRILLISISRFPHLSKLTVAALVDISRAIHLSATPAEISLLLQGLLSQEAYVRNACLQALQPFDLTELDWSSELWIACHDDDEPNATLADSIWEDNGLDVAASFVENLLPFLDHENRYVRQSCARAISVAVKSYPQTVGGLLAALKEFYRIKAKILAPEYDAYGMLIESSLDRLDPWPARHASASTFEHLAPDFTETDVVPFFDFLIQDEALGDRHADVRRGMLAAGTAVIDSHGKARLPHLLSMFEAYLGQKAASSETADFIREAVIILLGRLAQHLDSSDSRIPLIVERLVDALKTPSEVVQSAVAECLSPLVKQLGDKTESLVQQLLESLTSAPKYAERRGAAYGLAGVIHGRGISGLKEFGVIRRLKEAMEDKKQYEARQGAIFALETLSAMLGRLFEPYIIQILPLLLAAFGDQNPEVREATQDAAKVIMSNMSGYCVKSILPDLLSGLDEKQWRTKKGSIELLGTMAFCAPKQLSVSLPTVIPRLTGVLTDSHAQVRSAANKSLKQFGEVISNPEIQSLVPTLLKALVDPEKTPNALTALLKKSFVHYIDSPSLALLIPILERGMKERGAETKRKAAQIVGNMASLTDSKDFIPYLSRLTPFVHIVLVDPVPEARATAAKALGTLIERLGEANFPDLVSSLLQTLKTDTSGVDRQGAAQGLSEVLSGLGMDRMEGLLPEIITNANSPRPYVREGFMSLLVFLPATFGHRFAPHLSRIIPPILNGLADSEEYVRAASMKAGRMIIGNYSNKAIDLLLPELERGMFDSSWRIRHSSITLVGELLYKVSGISGKNEIEEDDEGEADAVVAESSRKALTEVLGKERRDRILGSLYIIRQDAVHAVRQASIHIWKALVHNTPRTIREILPVLLDEIINLLANDGDDQRETAARTMGELCRKLGEKIIGEIVPILRRGAEASDSKTREGVCLALSELLINTTEPQREGYEDEIIDAVRVCLVDESPRVRVAAAQAFDVLQEYIGGRAIDQTIPTLLEALRHPGASSGTALQALREIMTVRATTVFPVLIPTLVTMPITKFNAQALASLVTVAGSALSKRLTPILSALTTSMETEKDEGTVEAVKEAITALMGSIEDLEGLHSLMMLLLGWAKNETAQRRASACTLFAVFCENTSTDFSDYRVDWIRQLVSLLDDKVAFVHEASWKALDEFVKSIDKDEMEGLVVTLRRTIDSTGAPGVYVPGFGLAKGISPMLPIIFAGLTTGSNEQREQAALAIADLVQRTEPNAIRPYTTQLTGPLIRVITQATTYPPPVKSAILVALTTMLELIPAFVKPFFPQLQRTFVKSVTDPALSVRSKAAYALAVLMRSQPRVDPLITELVQGAKSDANEEAVKGSLVSAIAGVVASAEKNVGQGSKDILTELVIEAYSESHEDAYVRGVGEIVAALAADPEVVRTIFEKYALALPPHPVTSQILLHTVTSNPDVFYALKCVPMMVKKVQASIGTDQPIVARPAREAKELLRTEKPWVDDESVQAVFGA